MPKVKYIGPFDSVTLAVNGVDVQRNHQVEVDQETFDSLVEQSDWVAVESKPKAEKPKKAAAKKAAGGSTLVGEQGPELVDLPPGTQVIPAPSGEPDEGEQS